MKRAEKRYYREIGVLLLIKIALVILIRVLFFSHPQDKAQAVDLTAAHLLGEASAVASATPILKSQPPEAP